MRQNQKWNQRDMVCESACKMRNAKSQVNAHALDGDIQEFKLYGLIVFMPHVQDLVDKQIQSIILSQPFINLFVVSLPAIMGCKVFALTSLSLT